MKKLPLQIELVPEKAWGHNLRELIPASQWDIIKQAVFKCANYQCEICKGYGVNHRVECHEIWDFDEKSRLQKLEGLIALCPWCHQVKHIGFAMNHKSDVGFAKIFEHLKKVNNLTTEEANIYIRNVFNIQRRRSSMRWIMDIQWLENNFDFDWSKKAKQSDILIKKFNNY